MAGYCFWLQNSVSVFVALTALHVTASQQTGPPDQLVGFGLVVGLNGTGSKCLFTQQVAEDTLQRFMVTNGIQENNAFKPGNIAAVLITADLGRGARIGSHIAVTVSAIDDTTSLENGTLILTPLKGVDGVEYVTAIGHLTVIKAVAAPQGPNNLTVGRITNGAVVVRLPR